MKTLVIKTAKEFKNYLKNHDITVISINGVKHNGLYPLVTVTNHFVSYYDVNSQSERIINEPFKVEYCKN